MKKEEARRAVLSEYDRWAKKHPNDASMMGGFLFFRYLQKERSDLSSCKYRKNRKPPIMLAALGCFLAQLSYSLRTARLASSFFMLSPRGPFPMPSSNKNYRPFLVAPMSVMPRKRRSATKMRSVAMGQTQTLIIADTLTVTQSWCSAWGARLMASSTAR